jgi:hypothetical protein
MYFLHKFHSVFGEYIRMHISLGVQKAGISKMKLPHKNRCFFCNKKTHGIFSFLFSTEQKHLIGHYAA